MKVCPHCKGITEEKNAIKCAICGHSIIDEPDYSKEDLENESIKQYIALKQRQKENNKKKKIIIPIIIVAVLLIGIITLVLITKPKGHILITRNEYEMKVGERIIIEPIYYGDIKAEDLEIKIEILGSSLNVPFRYEIIDNNFCIDAFEVNEVVITFVPNDDGEQHKYNNKVKIIITSSDGGEFNE